MTSGGARSALVFALRNRLEHNPAVVYKTVFLGETVSLIEALPDWTCTPIDLDTQDESLTSLIGRFSEKPDAVLIWCETHQALLARQIATMLKNVSPQTRTFVFGRATAFMPQFFERYPFDAVHVSGDREAAIRGFLAGDLASPGISSWSNTHGGYRRKPGQRLPAAAWPFPSLKKLPLEAYAAFTERTHGPLYSKRISITVSKGCGLACAYCGATTEEGAHDRRRSADSVVEWVMQQPEQEEWLLHLFSPDLFFDHAWIQNWCDSYRSRRARFGWRGVTTTRALQDRDLVVRAGANGCRELAIGIEHVRKRSGTSVKSTLDELKNACKYTTEAGIFLKGLVMLGYPGQREEDILFLEELAQDYRLTLRYTGYTPLHRLKSKTAAELDALPLDIYDRRTYFDPQTCYLSPRFFYERIVRDGGYFIPR